MLSSSFKERFANTPLAQWAGLRIGHTRPLVRLPACVIFLKFFSFFATQLLMYYNIAANSVSFAAQRLHYANATYSVYDSVAVASLCLYGNGARLPAHSLFR